jgi:hypothetical protein
MGRIFILKYEVIRKGKTARQNSPRVLLVDYTME